MIKQQSQPQYNYSICPYNQSHRFEPQKYESHIGRCKQGKKTKHLFTICLYNCLHIFKNDAIEQHLLVCPDRTYSMKKIKALQEACLILETSPKQSQHQQMTSKGVDCQGEMEIQQRTTSGCWNKLTNMIIDASQMQSNGMVQTGIKDNYRPNTELQQCEQCQEILQVLEKELVPQYTCVWTTAFNGYIRCLLGIDGQKRRKLIEMLKKYNKLKDIQDKSSTN